MLIATMLIGLWTNAQNLVLTGKITDQKTKQPIEGVNVFIESLQKGNATSEDGTYAIRIPKAGKYRLHVSFIGYKTEEKLINITPNSHTANFSLVKDVSLLDNVEITAKKKKRASVAKIDIPLKDIPITTAQVSQELFDQVQVNNVNDALRYVTGIKPTVNYGGFQTFKMRGFGSPIMMLDGARDERMNLSNSAPVTSLAAVERIEYLKGPSSVLYGHSAVGGIINIVRKQPIEEFTANFSGTYGTWNRKRTQMGAGGKICDKLNYRLDASLSDSENWRDNATKAANAYLGLDYSINTKNKIEFRWAVNDDFYGTETGFPIITDSIFDLNDNLTYQPADFPKEFSTEQRYNDPQDFLKHKNYNLSLKYIHNFSNDSKLSIYAAYADDLIDYFSTESLSYPTDDSPVYDNYFFKKGKKKYIDLTKLQRTFPLRFSHETRSFQNYLEYTMKFLTGNIKHNFLGGYYIMHLDRVSFKGYNLGTDVFGDGLYAKVDIKNPILNQGNLEEQFSAASIYDELVNSLYIQDLMDISEKLKVMLSTRYDNYDMDYQSASVSSGRELTDKSEKKTLINNAFSYRLGLVYKPSKDLSLYSSISNYFKPNRSTYNPNYIYIDKDGKEFFPKDGKEIFKPESGFQVEGGFKYNYEEILDVNFVAYYIKKENIKTYLGKTDDDKRIYGQIGIIDSKGFEFDATIRPIKGLSLTTGYTYSDAKYQDFSANPYNTESNEGNVLNKNPEHQFFMWNYYTIPEGFLQNLSLGFGVNYTGSMFTNTDNTYELPEYWLAEASIGYSFENVYLRLKANNIFNEKYFSNSVFSTQFIPGEERNFLFTVGYKL
ncbi:iron complex outermembrane receptor protein [Balneicella halophila]|uniref:Iron complex outermembrane receptor protein n=2 Tax=Balneicella halophila TaxID=1537566 RepID=A0A7L4UNX8_BALHA|nr:iron complex outermembrane receptor protein [Balneicella halophila]